MLKLGTELRKRFSQLRLQLKRVRTGLSSVSQRTSTYLQRVDDWLYQRDLTKRRAKHYLRTALRGAAVYVPIGLFWILFLLNLLNANIQKATLAFLMMFPEVWFGGLESFALAFGLDGSELATIATADLIVVIAVAVANFLVFKNLTSEGSQFPRARLSVFYGLWNVKARKTTFHLRVSNEEGEDNAPNCRALAIFNDIEKRDVIDDPNTRTIYNSKNFKHTLRIPLPWRNGQPRRTLVSGDDGFDNPLVVLRLVQAKDSIPAHFEIPCTGIRSGVKTAICLNLKHYYGILRIHPERGKFKQFRFSITRGPEVGWFFLCGLFDDPMRRFLS